MTEEPIHSGTDPRNSEDYTGSLCWLLPKGEHTIIDVETIPLMEAHKWFVGRVGAGKHPRVMRSSRGDPKQRTIYLHRELTGEPFGLTVDHWNLDTRDNRDGNLRVCTAQQNAMNTPGKRGGTSWFRGVHWHAKARKWKVMTGSRERRIYLGSFDCEVTAARVYNAYAADVLGPFAYLNPV